MRGNFGIAARLAASRHGCVTWQLLVDEGIHRHTVQRWLDDARLHEVHHGVYAVGHRGLSVHGRYMAAVLACGEGAVLSHRAAAHLLRLLPGGPPVAEVTVPTVAGRRRPGIVIHRVRSLDRRDTSELEGIPITTGPRVLLDLAPSVPAAPLGRACHEAWVRHHVSRRHIEECIARNPRKPGARRLLDAAGGDVTLSVLEDAFLALLRDHGLPPPRTNVDRHGDQVACHWPEENLTVELQSYRFHASRQAFEADIARRRRSQHLAFSYGDVVERGPRTASELRRALACDR